MSRVTWNNASPSTRSSFGVVNCGDNSNLEALHATRARPVLMTKEPQGTVENRGNTSTDGELYAWTLRREAVAPCLIEDILHLRPNYAKGEFLGPALATLCHIMSVDYDFNWLGRVPCRSVKIVGMLVGIKDYESKRIYTGTTPPTRFSVLAYRCTAPQLTTARGSLNATTRI